jgi:ABC-type polysaccharide/polyol phosphate export permease
MDAAAEDDGLENTDDEPTGRPAVGVPLTVYDPASFGDNPSVDDKHYRHRPKFIPSVRELWNRRSIVFRLAERDIRANYKDATLGIAWAIIYPILMVIVLSLVFTRVHLFATGTHIPYAVYAYSGLICWYFFSGVLGSGASAVLTNASLLSKVHFPREAFPLSTIAQSSLTTALSLIPLAGLMALHHVTPKIETLWAPLFMLIEVTFALGIVLFLSAVIMHVRDFSQVVPLITTLGLFATPVIWPFSKIPVWFQPFYSFLNPIGVVIDNVRRTMLLGQPPLWNLLWISGLSALTWLVGGYIVFKRLEGDFADIA